MYISNKPSQLLVEPVSFVSFRSLQSAVRTSPLRYDVDDLVMLQPVGQ